MLDHDIKIGLDISAETEILQFLHTGGFPKNITARVILGSTANPIVGSSTYVLTFYINNLQVSPTSIVEVGAVTKTTFESRILSILAGDVVSIRITGQPADTSVDTDSYLIDFTPFTQAELEAALGDLSIVIDDPDAFVEALGGIITVGSRTTVLGACLRPTITTPGVISSGGTVRVNQSGSGPVVTITRTPVE